MACEPQQLDLFPETEMAEAIADIVSAFLVMNGGIAIVSTDYKDVWVHPTIQKLFRGLGFKGGADDAKALAALRQRLSAL